MGNGMMTQQERDYFEALSRKCETFVEEIARSFRVRKMGATMEIISPASAHFVYELLQNADDVGATRVRFELREEGLVFAHNGPRDFSITDPAREEEDDAAGRLGDINAITAVGASTKAENPVAIGKFGIGFKTVFRYTQTPRIYSPKWRFRLERVFIPVALEGDFPGREAGETLFFLPFDKPECPRKQAYDEIEARLRELLYPTLFLSHLRSIDVAIRGTHVVYAKESGKPLCFGEGDQAIRAEPVRLTRRAEDREDREALLLFSRKTEMGLDYSVGFFLDREGRLCAKPNVPAFCYFRTQVHTGLNFIVHAPFMMEISRESFAADAAYNRRLLAALAKLAADALPCLRDIGERTGLQLIDDGLLNVIPVDPEAFPDPGQLDTISFRACCHAIKLKLQTERLLPTRTGCTVRELAYWAPDKALAQLFSDAVLPLLVKRKGAQWAFASVGREDVRCANYVREVVGTCLDEQDVLAAVDKGFVKGVGIQWLKTFYAWVAKSPGRVAAVRDKPILLTNKGRVVAPFNEAGEAQVFLPPADWERMDFSGYDFVHPDLVVSREAQPFLAALHLKEPDLSDYVLKILIPRHYRAGGDPAERVGPEAWLRHFGMMFACYKELLARNGAEAEDFARSLGEAAILSYAQGEFPEAFCLGRPDSIYFDDEDLKAYFAFDEETRFLWRRDYGALPDDPAFEGFLERIGVRREPRVRVSHKPPQGAPLGVGLRQAWETPRIDGCEAMVGEILENEDEEGACLLWRLLLRVVEREGYASAEEMEARLQAQRITHRGPKEVREPFGSADAKRLRESAWVPTRDGAFAKPADLTLDGLDAQCEVDTPAARVLAAFLGIRPVDVRFLARLRDIVARHGVHSDTDLARLDEMLARTARPGRTAAPTALPDEPPETADSDEEKKGEAEEDQDEDAYSPLAVNYGRQNQEQEEENDAEREQIDRRKELLEQAESAPAYSCAWYRALLGLELEAQLEAVGDKPEISIAFGKVSRDPETKRTLVLEYPNRPIPPRIEELSGIAVKFAVVGRSGTLKVTAENVSIKDYTLRVKLDDNASLQGVKPEAIYRATITVKNPNFLLEELQSSFEGLALPNDLDLRDRANLPRDIRFVFGPPGTGKTTTLAREHLIPEMKSAQRVLVLAPTNKAADVLTRRVMACDPEGHRAWLIRFGGTDDKELEDSEIFHPRAFHLGDRAVVVSTIARFPYDAFNDYGQTRKLCEVDWDLIVVDEASMIPLYAILHLFCRAKGARFIVAGDPNQIEPIAAVSQWKELNVYSLVGLKSFANPTTLQGYPVTCLTTQYRSLPVIGTLFSKLAYDGCLQHARTAMDRRPLALGSFDWLRAVNVVKFPVSRYESIFRANRLGRGSCYHIYSALLAFECLNRLAHDIAERNVLSPDAPCRIGLVSPYVAQATIVRNLAIHTGLIASCRAPYARGRSPAERDKPKLPGVEVQVGTVHGFQGDECDILLALFNPPPSISASKQMFLNKLNIVNVSISRARDALVLLIPDDDTENVGQLTCIEELKRLINQTDPADVARRSADELERVLFGETGYIERNTFVTGHQSVNVYEQPEYRYEVRSEASAIDIQVRP